MKIIFVNKPSQTAETLDPQIIDGKIYHWCVNDEMAKTNESFQEWWVRKQEWMVSHSKGKELVNGIFLYNITPLSGVIGVESKVVAGLIIRYQWIKIEL